LHDWGGEPQTLGDFRPANYGNTEYTNNINSLFSEYSSIVQELGFTPFTKKPVGAYGSSPDDGYNNGETLVFLCEETSTYSTPSDIVNYDLIHNVKTYHMRAFVMAVSELYGVDPEPTPTPTPTPTTTPTPTPTPTTTPTPTPTPNPEFNFPFEYVAAGMTATVTAVLIIFFRRK